MDSDLLPSYTPEASLEVGDKEAVLYLGNTAVCTARLHEGRMRVHWQIYGPVEAKEAMALMQGFIHLTAWLNKVQGAEVGRPVETDEEPSQPRKFKRRSR